MLVRGQIHPVATRTDGAGYVPARIKRLNVAAVSASNVSGGIRLIEYDGLRRIGESARPSGVRKAAVNVKLGNALRRKICYVEIPRLIESHSGCKRRASSVIQLLEKGPAGIENIDLPSPTAAKISPLAKSARA